MFIVYILYSKEGDVFYKGFTENIENRLKNHLEGNSPYTSRYSDWTLVFSQSFDSKKEALIEEKRLKKLNRASIEKLVSRKV